jgi:hypothetical protein
LAAAPIVEASQARAPGTGRHTRGTEPDGEAAFAVSTTGARKSWPPASVKLISGV